MIERRTGSPTPEEIDRIAELLTTKEHGARQIAEIMGRTKGSIMGIIWRSPRLKKIGLPDTPRIQRIANAKKFNEKIKRVNRVVRAPNLKSKEPEVEIPEPEPVFEPEPVYTTGPRPLMHLGSTHCKFPLWGHHEKPSYTEMMFCAEARMADSPYCEPHHKLCVSLLHQKAAKVKLVA